MDLITALEVLFLGLVEGVTEWLPISSTGHMLLVDEFLQLPYSQDFKSMFFVVIQLGAILAVVVLFWGKLFPFDLRRDHPLMKRDAWLLWAKVLVACLPAIVAGLPLDDWLEAHLHTPVVIAAMLILYGVAFILVERWNRGRKPRIGAVEDLGFGTAFAIGMFQVLSLIPGTSRSGATIVGALILGVSRTAAAEFTFFLAVPVMFGASALKLVKFGFAFTGGELAALILGVISAFVVSMAVIRFLMAFVKRHDFQVFGWYRIVLGAVVLVYFLVLT